MKYVIGAIAALLMVVSAGCYAPRSEVTALSKRLDALDAANKDAIKTTAAAVAGIQVDLHTMKAVQASQGENIKSLAETASKSADAGVPKPPVSQGDGQAKSESKMAAYLDSLKAEMWTMFKWGVAIFIIGVVALALWVYLHFKKMAKATPAKGTAMSLSLAFLKDLLVNKFNFSEDEVDWNDPSAVASAVAKAKKTPIPGPVSNPPQS
jgi:hypothetical protein